MCVRMCVRVVVEAVRSITDDGMWLQSHWGDVCNKCAAGALNVSPVTGRTSVLISGVFRSTVFHTVVVSVLT
jgi:hypothetical protein